MAKKTQSEANRMLPTPQHCPNCGSQKLILYGAVRRAVEQGLDNGKAVGKHVVRKGQEIVWDRISCVTCGAHYKRTDDRVLRLQEEVEKLRFELALMTGQLVSENRLPC